MTNLINCYDEMTGLVDEERIVDNFYVDFMKTFNSVSHSILIEKMKK